MTPMQSSPAPTDTAPPIPAESRWSLIDSLRGFAIAGILFVNSPDLVQLGYGLTGGSGDVRGIGWLQYFVQTRFVPIFTMMFGVSMVFVRRGAVARGRSPWVALLLRLIVLFAIGLGHALVYPGEVLREYAAAGLLVVPVVMLAPGLVQLGAGVVLVAVADAFLGGGLAATPGLMLAGAGLAACGAPRALESRSRSVVTVFLLTTALLVPALWWQSTQPGDPRFSKAGLIAGTVMAVWYVTGLSLLWQTRARKVMAAAFEPLGRLALTNYVSASLVVWTVDRFVDFRSMDSVVPVAGLAVAVLTAQSLLGRRWLQHHRYGPLEWVWRMLTWRQRVPLMRQPDRSRLSPAESRVA